MSGTVLVTAVAVCGLVSVVAIAGALATVVESVRIGTVADAAAIGAAAGAVGLVGGDPGLPGGGCDVASRVAAASGSTVESCEPDGATVTVTVRSTVGAFALSATARAGPAPRTIGSVRYI